MAQTRHVLRRLESILPARMNEVPVVLLQGPRSVGKSTLLHSLAADQSVQVLDFDDPGIRDMVMLDPPFYVSGQRPVLIDEYQKAPEILDYVKSELNRKRGPGQFVLTGSTRYDALPTVAQSLTGRLHRLTVHPFAQAELEGHSPNLVGQLFDEPDSLLTGTASTTSRAEYVSRIARGGFPLVQSNESEAARNRWFEDYIDLTLRRDALAIRQLQRASSLPALLERLAGQTAQVLNIRNAAQVVGLEPSTATEYARLLETLFVIFLLPAWGKTLTARTARSPKVHVLDSGVAARLLRLSESKLGTADPTVQTEFGHLLETFVVNELLRHASWLDENVLAGHWRTHDRDEVDLVLERDDGHLVAIEVKASTRIRSTDFRSLRKLKDAVGHANVTGVVFYLGGHSIRTAEQFLALPVDALWT